MKTIEQVYVAVVRDANGEEGVPSVVLGNKHFPLIRTKPAALPQLKMMAQSIANATHREIRIIHFAGPPVEVETITPIGRAS